jgi:putative transposase
MAIKKNTLDELPAGRDPQEVFNKDSLFDELKKALAERVLNAEIEEHLDGGTGEGRKNHRNGYSSKNVIAETSNLDIRVPSDREGTFDPKLIARYQRREALAAAQTHRRGHRERRRNNKLRDRRVLECSN